MDQYLSTVEAATNDGLLKKSSELVGASVHAANHQRNPTEALRRLVGSSKAGQGPGGEVLAESDSSEMTVRQLHSRTWIRENVWDIGAGHTRKADGVDWDEVPRSDASPQQPDLELPRAEEKLLDMGRR